MRVLSSVVGPRTPVVFCHKAYSSEGCRVRAKFVCHDPGGREALLLEQLLHQLLGGFGISLALDEDVQNLAFMVDGAPQPIALASDDDHHFVEVPVITGLRVGAAQIGGNDGSKLQEPSADGLVGDVQAPLGEHLLDIAEADSEPGVEPDRVADNFGREAVRLNRTIHFEMP